MAAIPFPIHVVSDDAGAIVAGATVTIASVTNKDGGEIASHGATVSLSGANVCVNYDPEMRGDAWIELSVSKAGSTFTNFNAAPRQFVSRDPQQLDARVSTRLATADKSGFTLAPGGLDSIVIEVGINARQALSPILAAVAGAASGQSTATAVFMAGGSPGTTRITATTTEAGDRTAVILNLPA